MQVYAQVFGKEIKINELSHTLTPTKPIKKHQKHIKPQIVAKKNTKPYREII